MMRIIIDYTTLELFSIIRVCRMNFEVFPGFNKVPIAKGNQNSVCCLSDENIKKLSDVSQIAVQFLQYSSKRIFLSGSDILRQMSNFPRLRRNSVKSQHKMADFNEISAKCYKILEICQI